MRPTASALVATAFMLSMSASLASAAINLELRPRMPMTPVGARVEFVLYAVSDDNTEQTFSAADIIITWDPAELALVEAIPGDHPWVMSGFMPDPYLDGINDLLTDGDAVFTVLSMIPVTAPPQGFAVASFRFDPVVGSGSAQLMIEEAMGKYAETKVFEAGGVEEDVTGELIDGEVTIVSEETLSATDVVLPAGGTAAVFVSGEIGDIETNGVMIMVELVPREGATGSVEFTPAPPVDIALLDDPWAGQGTFSPYDTDLSGGGLRNGSIMDNGTHLVAPLDYAGSLVSFPIIASPEASGVWDVKLCTESCTVATMLSRWEAARVSSHTGMHHGVLTIVSHGDRDGNGLIGLGEFSGLEVCFTDSVGPVDPPAYPLDPELGCSVYDFDGDGDIDGDDYSAFGEVMFGPAP